MTHVIVLGIVALAVLIIGFVVGMCITAKRADEAMTQAINERIQKEKL